MTEKLISLETAKLAKEKGFDPRSWEYWSNKELRSGVLDNGPINWNSDSDYSGPEVYAAPTQSLLQKWLRDKHFIFIQIDRENIGSDEWEFAYRLEWLPKEHQDEKRRWSFFKEKKSFVDNYPYNYSGAWHTYEEALEAGLLESLKLV